MSDGTAYGVIGGAWIATFLVAMFGQSMPAAICFAAISYGIAHWEHGKK